MIKNKNNDEILKDDSLKSLFLSAYLGDVNEKCKILKGSFYLDSFNYYPITENYQTFHDLFKRHDDNSIDHFYNREFYNNLLNKKKNLKIIENTFVLGSNIADNYFSNLINFIPRIFFTNEKKINIVIQRNLSNKFRNLIMLICEMRNIDMKYTFIDDNFYKFNNSSIPQFFSIEKSVKILKYFFEKILFSVKTLNFGKRIYIRREDSHYRKILNEADLIEKLRIHGFEIINPNHFEILEQMKIFSSADLIISAHGSNLSNLIFCKKGTKVLEICPNLNNSYEINISNRYKHLSSFSNLVYSKFTSDSVDVKSHSDLAKKYISNKILNESNYYKSMILKVSEIDKLINNL